MMKIAAVIFACALSFNASAQSTVQDASSSDQASESSTSASPEAASPSLARSFGKLFGTAAKGVFGVVKEVSNGFKDGMGSRPATATAAPTALAPVETVTPVMLQRVAVTPAQAASDAHSDAASSAESSSRFDMAQLQQRLGFLPFFGKPTPPAAKPAVTPETSATTDKVSQL